CSGAHGAGRKGFGPPRCNRSTVTGSQIYCQFETRKSTQQRMHTKRFKSARLWLALFFVFSLVGPCIAVAQSVGEVETLNNQVLALLQQGKFKQALPLGIKA